MKYRKLPVEVDAYLWDGNVINPCGNDVPNWLGKAITIGDVYFEWQNEAWVMIIPTLEGKVIASKGDYIIQGVKGELYPCKPDIFEMTYEEVLQ